MENSDESGSGKQGQQVNYTEPATTRLTDQTYEQFVRYTEQEGVGKSEALRRLIRTGLDEDLDEEEETEGDEHSHSADDILLVFGVVLGLGVAGGYTSGGGNPDVTLVYVTAAMVGAGLLLRFNKP